MRYRLNNLLLLIFPLLLAACASPTLLPAGPTSIPTLVPATEPAVLPGAEPTRSFTIQSYPARLPSAELGKPIYETHCAECHGMDGQGVVPGARNFNDLDYVRGETPANFYAAVTEGRGEMAGFSDTLSSDERWDVVFYIWRFSTDADTLALGNSLYDENCAACHGEDGVGTVLGAADFTDLRFMDDSAPRDFYLTVTQGKGSMPAWQGRLSQDERWASIDYVYSFAYDAELPGETVATPDVEVTPTAVKAACSEEYLSQSNPFAWDDAEAIAAGQVIYNQSCGMCHGADGSGSLVGTPDFTSPEVSADLRTNSGEYLCITAEGSQAMPGWKETLTTEQMWQVLTYMGTFGN